MLEAWLAKQDVKGQEYKKERGGTGWLVTEPRTCIYDGWMQIKYRGKYGIYLKGKPRMRYTGTKRI